MVFCLEKIRRRRDDQMFKEEGVELLVFLCVWVWGVVLSFSFQEVLLMFRVLGGLYVVGFFVWLVFLVYQQWGRNYEWEFRIWYILVVLSSFFIWFCSFLVCVIRRGGSDIVDFEEEKSEVRWRGRFRQCGRVGYWFICGTVLGG